MTGTVAATAERSETSAAVRGVGVTPSRSAALSSFRTVRSWLPSTSGHRVVGKVPSSLPFSSRTHPASTVRSASSSRRFSVSFSIAASGFSGLDVPMSWTCR